MSTHIQNNTISIILSHVVLWLQMRKNKKLSTIYSSYNASDSVIVPSLMICVCHHSARTGLAFEQNTFENKSCFVEMWFLIWACNFAVTFFLKLY